MAPEVQELHPSHVSIPVTISRLVSVEPAGPTTASFGSTLYLSNLDDMFGTRMLTPTIYFYRTSLGQSHPRPVVRTLHEALSRVLVPYYPLSGRLRETKQGKLEVFFGAEQGALMVEARSEMTLGELGDLTVPNPTWAPLVYRFPDEEPFAVTGLPLLTAQVTLFRCGGFSLGLRLSHCICDGAGAMQFIAAWAATALAGTPVTSPAPCWGREAFWPRDPPLVQFPHMEFTRVAGCSNLANILQEGKLVQKSYCISRAFQSRLKALAHSSELPCTTFDALAAHIWRSWVKTLAVSPPDSEMRLNFSVNTRGKLANPPLQQGFYGNVLCVACAVSSVSDLVNATLADTARLIHEARIAVTEDYLRSTVDYLEVNRSTTVEFNGRLAITQWTRFPIYECSDFGWGRAAYAGPADMTLVPQVCVLLPAAGADPDGKIMLSICLPDCAAHKFIGHLEAC